MRFPILVLLSGCIVVKDDVADTDTPVEKDVQIAPPTATCAGNGWTFSAQIDGVQGSAILHIKDTGPSDPTNAWGEVHDAPARQEAADSTTYKWDLDIAEFQVDYVPNISTLTRCEDQMSFAVQVFSLEEDLVDCVAWGAKPSWFDEDLDGGCREVSLAR